MTFERQEIDDHRCFPIFQEFVSYDFGSKQPQILLTTLCPGKLL